LSDIIPTNEAICEFNKLVKAMGCQIEANHMEICNLQMMRDTLLPKLMFGEITSINEV